MIRPPPRFTSKGAKARMAFAVPVRLTSITLRHASSDLGAVLHFEQRLESLDAGVGVHDVEAAELPLRSGGGRSQRRQVSLVEDDAQPAATGRLDEPSCLVQVLRPRRLDTGAWAYGRADVDADDVRALAREGDGRGAADPACGTARRRWLRPALRRPGLRS